jgi:hypothetical protein
MSFGYSLLLDSAVEKSVTEDTGSSCELIPGVDVDVVVVVVGVVVVGRPLGLRDDEDRWVMIPLSTHMVCFVIQIYRSRKDGMMEVSK